ncbi:MAG: apolipoprotein N-acyltransferase [Candidatus Krumholzibacteria bacterium]|nr:apolipoprotein N-acyltransferase [Candidatus Krumholzibacteria bacterium]
MAGRNNWIARWRDELVAGVASGLLLALCFPPFPTRFLAGIALVPLFRYYIARPRPGIKRAIVLGFFVGVSFFTALLIWILKLIPESGVTMPWILGPGLALLVAYLSCYTALFTLALSFLTGRLGPGALFAAPALWSLVEFARSHGELGFSWGMLGTALAIHPLAIQGAAVYGPFGLSLMLVLANVCVAWALFGGGRRARLAAASSFVALVLAHLLFGAVEIARFDREKVRLNGTGGVAVMQPNVDLGLKFETSFRDSIFRQMERYSAEASRHGASLIIFPETAAPVSFKATPQYLDRLEADARGDAIDILTGYVDHTVKNGEWIAHNAAALISKDGELTGNYHKVNLLPFGEKMPWSQYFPALTRLDFGQANFVSGKEQTIFDSSVGRFGVLICFESSFSDFTRRYVRDGSDFLVNITNDGWFGNNQGPFQHAEMAILRSVENRVTLFRAAYTGVSMIVDPVGRVCERIDPFTEGMIYGTVERSARPTIYTRHGYAVFFLLAAANLVLACVPPMLGGWGAAGRDV